MVMLAVLVLAVCILGFGAAGIGLQTVAGSLGNHGPHGLSEVLYAYTSGVGNNGSAFAGLNANTPYLNTTLGLAMLCGRFLMLIPLLAAAGSLAQKKVVPVSAGTFPYPWTSVRHAAGRSGGDCGRFDILPGAFAGSDRGTFPDAPREAVELVCRSAR